MTVNYEIIPLTPDPDSRIVTTLDNIKVYLDLRWNAAAESWKLDLISADGTIEARGLRLSPGVDLLFGLTITELGSLYVSDTQFENAEPTYDDLGDRFVLWYLPVGEVVP